MLAVPGPLAMPPGEINPSRPRSRYVLYWAEVAGTRTPWAPDFNSVGASGAEVASVAAARTWDPLHEGDPEPFGPEDLRRDGIDALVIVRDELRGSRADRLRSAFEPWIVHADQELIVAKGW